MKRCGLCPLAARLWWASTLHLGLAAFGQEGVETVLALLRADLELVMKQMGTLSVPAFTKDYVV